MTTAFPEDLNGHGPFTRALNTAEQLRDALSITGADVAVVCGSGFSQVAAAMGAERHVAMAEVGLPAPAVAGHGGDVWAGTVRGRNTLIFAGRVHLYEGRPVEDTVAAVRAAAALGCRSLVVTNAAGSLHPSWAPGTTVALKDHLNLTGANPLAGTGAGSRSSFVDMTAAYDPAWLERVRAEVGDLPQGVYASLAGPSYETPAEIGMLKAIGADLVGMSTTCEVIAARHCAMSVFGASLVTNLAAGMAGELSHAEVTETGAASRDKVVALLCAAVMLAP